MNFSDEIISLGKSLSTNGAQYKAQELFQGIKHEQIRLGKNQFIVIVNINSFDIDGVTDYVFLIDSFSNEEQAESIAHKLSRDLLEYQSKQVVLGRSWTLESRGASPYLSETKSNSAFKTVLYESFKVVLGEFDGKYVITRVLKSDGGFIIGQPLFDAINSNFDLWSFLIGVGEAGDGKRAHPTPFFNG